MQMQLQAENKKMLTNGAKQNLYGAQKFISTDGQSIPVVNAEQQTRLHKKNERQDTKALLLC
jgi:hypothetical protein